MIPSLFAVSFLAFVLIQLPPGDFVTNYVATLAASNEIVDQQAADALRERFGLDQPLHLSVLASGSRGILPHGDFGISFEWQQPVSRPDLGADGPDADPDTGQRCCSPGRRAPDRHLLGGAQYSIGDYFVTFLGFIGLAIPNFLLALVLMYIAVVDFGQSVGGLFSRAVSDRALEPGPRSSTCCSISGSRSSSWRSPAPPS